MRTPIIRALYFCCLSCLAQVSLAEPVSVERDSDLYLEPRTDAKVVTRLRQGTQADAGTSKGAWTPVKTSAGAGWVLSFNLRFGGTAASAGGGNALSRLTAPRERTAVTSTIGIRGFDAEDLRKAQFDEQQIKLMERYGTSKQTAQTAAASAGLSAEKIDYLR